MDSDNENFSESEVEILKDAKDLTLNLLPDKSKRRYSKVYNEFKKWRFPKNTISFSEEIFLGYFNELAKNLEAPTLWLRFSMLKTTVKAYDNIEIGTYSKLIAYIKRLNVDYKSIHLKVFTKHDIEKFCNEAPDDEFLATKVALIIGVSGACRCEELSLLRVNDVDDHNSFLFIRLPATQKRTERGFTVVGNFYYKICKKYLNLRPKSFQSEKFFLNFKKGKYRRQPIKSGSFGALAREIANFLKLPNSECYTGHTFRHSSATLLVDVGTDIATLTQHEGRKSNSVTKGCIEKPLLRLKRIKSFSPYGQLPYTSSSPVKPAIPMQMQIELNNTLNDGFDNTYNEINFLKLISFDISSSQKSQIYSDSYTFSENELEKIQIADNVAFNLLSDKSKINYFMAYKDFKEWRSSKKVISLSEEVFLDYFNELAQNLESSTLWSVFLMLKATLKAYDNMDLGIYNELKSFIRKAYIKKLNIDHKNGKPKAFTILDIEKFCNVAPDKEFLVMKVALVIGISGGCTCEELSLLNVNNVEDHISCLCIRLGATQKRIERNFTVVGKFYEICKKYIQLRPKCSRSDRFFLHYKKGEYFTRGLPIENVALCSMPKKIARFLNFRSAEDYTGNAFWHSSKNLLEELVTLAQYKRRLTSSVAENNIQNRPLSKNLIRDLDISYSPTEKLAAAASAFTSASLEPVSKRIRSFSVHDQLPFTSTPAMKPSSSIPTEVRMSAKVMNLKYRIIVVNTDRTERKTYMTHAYLQEVIEKANKFGCPGKIVLRDEDGSEVCDDEILEYLLQRNTKFMICNKCRDWTPQNAPPIQTTKVIASSRQINTPEIDPSTISSTATETDTIINTCNLALADFSIPWDKVPTYIMALLEVGEPLSLNSVCILINFLIDEMLLIRQTIPFPVMKKVAEQVISRYPLSFLTPNVDKNPSEVINKFSTRLKYRYGYIKNHVVKSRNDRLNSVYSEKSEINVPPEHDIDIDVKIEFDSLSSND